MTDLPMIIDDRETPKFWVNRATMVEPEILELERERIFDKSWLYVGHESELPKVHDFRTRRVGGRPVIFTRSSSGSINVLVNTCTHRGMTIETRNEGNSRLLRCFYHGWSFNTDGELVAMPMEDDYPAGWKRAERCLPRPAHVASYRGFWFLCWDKAQRLSLEEYLGGASDFIDLVADQSSSLMEIASGTHLYSMRANWKLLVENSFDGYHFFTTHNRYLKMIVASGAKATPGAGYSGAYDFGNGHAAVGGTNASQGASVGGAARAFPSEETRADYARRYQELIARHGAEWTARILGSRNLLVFPNLMIIDLGMGCTVRTFYPDKPDYMEISAWEISPPELTPALRKMRLDSFLTFWGPAGLATPDDVEALERCQRGYASYQVDPWNDMSRGMGKERPGVMDELQMRAFWRRYNELMTGQVSKPEVELYKRTARSHS